MTDKIATSKALAHQLAEAMQEARQRLLALVADLSDDELWGPKFDIVNPPLWEIGHVAWFQELRVLRTLDQVPSLRDDADRLYDSFETHHEMRWDLPLPLREGTSGYVQQVLERCLQRLKSGASPEEAYFYQLATCHEDMHIEAMTYTRQTLGYPCPRFGNEQPVASSSVDERFVLRDVEVPGGLFYLGAFQHETRFIFDNEKWAHPVSISPFRISNTPVTNQQFLRFVEDGGYQRRELWSDVGWHWRVKESAEHPMYWRRGPGGQWRWRKFNQELPLEPYHPIIHVNWYESNAYCRWAGRRLPTEAEWEMAASAEPTPAGKGIHPIKRLYPWGNQAPTPERANLDFTNMGCVDVRALPAGDSAFGCRQMLGNVWEWTSDRFWPYPGFSPDPYLEYSTPWFGYHKVLRGGAWATSPRFAWNTFRNFFLPDRRDIFAGFRTCAL